jgi:uncharacterized repeat protein (TIGR01451 family)
LSQTPNVAVQPCGDPPALSLSKQVYDLSADDEVPFGQVVAYSLSLNNTGFTAATGAMITNTLPAGLTFGGWQQQGTAAINGNVITWGPGRQ